MKYKKLIIWISAIALFIALIIIKAFTLDSHNLTVREETIQSEKIDSNLDGMLIAYFSDLYYGKNITDEDIDKLVNTIKDFNPDLVIFGGDLLSDVSKNTSHLEEALESIKPSCGKYAVLGNSDKDNAINLLENAGFEILDNTNKKIYFNNSYINLIGISSNNSSIYEGINSNYYTFAISHMPDNSSELNCEKIDYILSGHSLGGPVYIPLINYLYRPDGATKYFKGKYKINNITLDITNGIGTINKDVRLFSNPEIVMYKLKTK